MDSVKQLPLLGEHLGGSKPMRSLSAKKRRPDVWESNARKTLFEVGQAVNRAQMMASHYSLSRHTPPNSILNRYTTASPPILVQLPDTVETLVSENLDELVRIEGHSRRRAKECLLGWFDSLGPAYLDTDVEEVCASAIRTAVDQGFRDIASAQELRGRWASAYQRWETMVRTAQGQSRGLYRGIRF